MDKEPYYTCSICGHDFLTYEIEEHTNEHITFYLLQNMVTPLADKENKKK